MLRPTNKEQKAYYEVETMRAYYHKLWR
jgi:hypothetical protein